MTPDDIVLSAVLNQALESPLGLLVRTGDFARTRIRLYAVRKALIAAALTSNPDRVAELQALEFRTSGVSDGDLLIIRHVPAGAGTVPQTKDLGL